MCRSSMFVMILTMFVRILPMFVMILRRSKSFVRSKPLEEIRRSRLAAGHVLLLPCPAILKPHLSHSFAEARDLSNSFKVLTIRIAVDLEICLQYLYLLFGEGRSHPFCLFFLHQTISITAFIRRGEATLQGFQVVSFAENSIIVQTELFASAQLSLT